MNYQELIKIVKNVLAGFQTVTLVKAILNVLVVLLVTIIIMMELFVVNVKVQIV